MKIFRGFFLTSIALIASFGSLHAMEPSDRLKSFIFDIQDHAADLTEQTGVTYKIVTKSKLFLTFLEILGLSDTNTLLDIKYHYELMKVKLLGQDELLKVITTAYNQVMGMIFEVGKYKEDVHYLLKISFKDLQSKEIEDGEELRLEAFLKFKNPLIDRAIASLKKQYPQHAASHQVSHQLGLPSILQTTFNLPANASPHVVDEHYKRYVENYKNYSNKLIAHATMKNISIQDLKDSLAELEKVSQAYEQYVQKRSQK
jgi:hypothetical protein